MKLELKHIAPYLPYGLKVLIENEIAEVMSCNVYEFVKVRPFILGYRYCDIYNLKPILRPLSDLDKDIEYNDYKLNPIDYLNTSIAVDPGEIFIKDNEWLCLDTRNIESLNILNYSYEIIEKLFEWHFDVFGLIPKGLAIDINTLNK